MRPRLSPSSLLNKKLLRIFFTRIQIHIDQETTGNHRELKRLGRFIRYGTQEETGKSSDEFTSRKYKAIMQQELSGFPPAKKCMQG